MTKEELIRYGKDYLHVLETACCTISDIHKEFVREAIKALEIVEEFEKAQIITGGRLNGRAFAYKCGLEAGKRKALEQQPSDDKVSMEVYKQVMSERDIAIEQLKKLGYELGEKIRTSDDCVSRKQAKIDVIPNSLYTSEQVIALLDNVPPVTPTQNWIPVSERLPKKTGWYFITFRFANGVAVCEASYRKPENYWTGKNISKKLFDNNEVVAWQPLPKPYEEKRGSE